VSTIYPPEEMRAFDQLPKTLKSALRDAPVYIEATALLPHYRSKGAKETLKLLHGWIAEWQVKNPIVKGKE